MDIQGSHLAARSLEILQSFQLVYNFLNTATILELTWRQKLESRLRAANDKDFVHDREISLAVARIHAIRDNDGN